MPTKTKSTTDEGVKVIDVQTVFGDYLGKDIFLALVRDRSKVIATGSTPEKAYRNAQKKGYSQAIIMKAPQSENYNFILSGNYV